MNHILSSLSFLGANWVTFGNAIYDDCIAEMIIYDVWTYIMTKCKHILYNTSIYFLYDIVCIVQTNRLSRNNLVGYCEVNLREVLSQVSLLDFIIFEMLVGFSFSVSHIVVLLCYFFLVKMSWFSCCKCFFALVYSNTEIDFIFHLISFLVVLDFPCASLCVNFSHCARGSLMEVIYLKVNRSI